MHPALRILVAAACPSEYLLSIDPFFVLLLRSPMKKRLLLVVGLVFLLAAADADEEIKKELARFEGTWKWVSIEMEKMKLSEDALKEPRLKLKGDKFTVTEENANATFGGTFKVDPSKRPKTIDVTFTDGPEKGKTSLGIYELEGDTYKVCVDPAGKSRPTEFAVKPGSGHVLQVLKREKK
jgi:uncharacterized protein (TIGR03067 family)